MRTKTLALSALLGMLGSASLVAQTNVYSLNAVGYINVTLFPGFNLISCPLISSPDNTIGTLFPNGGGGLPTSNQWANFSVFQWSPAITNYLQDTAAAKAANKNGYTNGWSSGGTIALNPGLGMWIDNPGATTNVTFVGTVPQNGSPYLTNVLTSGFNMVSSAIPMSGDLYVNTNTLLTGFENQNDQVYTWDPGITNYDNTDTYTTKHQWNSGAADPTTTNITEGFWYYVAGSTSETWTENFSVNP
jgi:hypothetical protein